MADLIDWMWAGALTERGFRVTIELLASATDARLLVSRNADLTNPVVRSPPKASTALAGPSAATYNVVQFECGGLKPDTRYYWTVETGAGIDTAKAAQITTAPVPLRPANFRIVVGSCSNPGFATPDQAFAAIKAENPLMLLHLGDLHYDDIGTDDLPANRAGIRKHTKLTDVLAFYKSSAVAYIYDDHDAGPNDAHQDTALFSTFMANTIAAYGELVPHYPLAQPVGVGWARGNAQSFTIGRVRFLMPDLRAFRNTTVRPKTVLGDGRTTSGFASWDQKTWLQSAMVQAKIDGCAMVVLLSSSTLPGTIGGSWEVEFKDEFADLMTFASENDLPELLIVSGDAHATGFDDGGVMSLLAPLAGARMAHVQASPMRSNALTGSGPFAWLGVDTETNNLNSSYVVLDFADAGDRITWTATPKDDTGAQFSGAKGGPFSNADTKRVVELAVDDTGIAATEAQVVLSVNKSWFGRCSVAWATEPVTPMTASFRGQRGVLTFGENEAVGELVIPLESMPDNQVFRVRLSDPADCELGSRTAATVAVVSGADVVPGLIQWVDADDQASMTLRRSGGDTFVSQLRDKSGKGNHFDQATEANQPKLMLDKLGPGRNVLRGDGTSDFMRGPVLYDSPRLPVTIIGIARATKIGATQRVFCLSNSASTPQHMVRFTATDKIECLARGSGSEGEDPDSLADAADAVPHLFCGRINAVPGRAETALDDEAFQVSDKGSEFANNLFTTSPTGSTLFVIDGSGGLAQYLQGDIACVAVFDRAISDAEWVYLRDGYLKPKLAHARFEPSQFGELMQWLEPFDTSTVTRRKSGTDTFVTVVADKSGQGNDVDADAQANEPKLVSDGGLPFLQAGGSPQFLRGPTVYSSPRDPATIIGIVRSRTTGANARVWSQMTASSEPQHAARFTAGNTMNPVLRGASGDGLADPSSLATAAGTGWHLFCTRLNVVEGRAEIALNDEAFQVEDIGALTNNLFTASGTGTTLFCGDGTSGLDQFLDGDIPVLAVFKRAISDLEWTQLRDHYLKPLLALL